MDRNTVIRNARKLAQRVAVDARLEAALRELYHNAPGYPYGALRWLEDEGQERAWRAFESAAEFELDWVNDRFGEASDAQARAWAARDGASPALVAGRMRERRRELEDMARRWPARRIGEWGKVYCYGRGGRTVAPDELVRGHGGGSFSIRRDWGEGRTYADRVDAIRVLESWNAYVARWPADWAEDYARQLADECLELEGRIDKLAKLGAAHASVARRLARRGPRPDRTTLAELRTLGVELRTAAAGAREIARAGRAAGEPDAARLEGAVDELEAAVARLDRVRARLERATVGGALGAPSA